MGVNSLEATVSKASGARMQHLVEALRALCRPLQETGSAKATSTKTPTTWFHLPMPTFAHTGQPLLVFVALAIPAQILTAVARQNHAPP